MKLSRFLLAPIFSFFDFKIYKEALLGGLGKAFFYLAYLTFISLLAGLTQLGKINSFLDWFPQAVPAMTLTQEGMRLDEPGFKDMHHPTLGQVAAFDDLRSTIRPDEMQNYRVFMTSKMIYWRAQPGDPIQSGEIGSRAKEPFQAQINAAALKKLINQFYAPLAVLVFVLLGAGLFLQKILFVLFFAFVGFLIQLFISRGLTFKNIFILACYSLSPIVVFSILQLIPGFGALFSNFVGFLLVLVYLALAISMQSKEKAQ